MKPLVHAMTAAKRFGGAFEDYLAVHEFMDASKMAVADNRHRALFHHDQGVAIAVATFGETLVNADGVAVPVRAVAERHCIEDVGFVPTLEQWIGDGRNAGALLGVRVRIPDLATMRRDPEAGLAERYGGTPQDYAAIVAHFDVGAARSGSRTGIGAATTLNAMTCVLAERRFGPALRVAGRKTPVPVREVGEMLALSRWGTLPPLHVVVSGVRLEPWMAGGCRTAYMRGAPCPAGRLAAAA